MRAGVPVIAVVAGALGGCSGRLPLSETGIAGTNGGAGTMGPGGMPGRGGATGAGGTAGMGSECPSSVSKSVPCGPGDPQTCFKTCGPEKVGTRSETCQGGVYAEMSGCTFDPARDYSCYAIPSAPNPVCPPGLTPQAGQMCDVPSCSACNSARGVAGGTYFDSAGAAKVGYCVCQAPNAAGARTWSCASDTAWPCPGPSCGTGGTGSGGTTGGTGTGGSTGSTGTGGSFGTPSCTGLVTAAGEEPYRGAACVATDPQVCYRTCGPEKTGVRAETCTIAGTYAESSRCTFDPARDYSCYRIPSTVNTACPAGVTGPQGSLPCDVPTCTVCNSAQGVQGGQILDSTGAAKIGYCVCQAPNAAGMRLWSCVSEVQWPCPIGNGC